MAKKRFLTIILLFLNVIYLLLKLARYKQYKENSLILFKQNTKRFFPRPIFFYKYIFVYVWVKINICNICEVTSIYVKYFFIASLYCKKTH